MNRLDNERPSNSREGEYTKAELNDIIHKEELRSGIPSGLLNSIAEVESKHSPYAVNARHKSHAFRTRDDASKFVNDSVKRGAKNISVGCLQIHYGSHRKNFLSVDDMLTPERNIAYAANLLRTLYKKYGSWEKAVRAYHSGKASRGKTYCKKVMTVYRSSVYKSS